MWIPRLSSAAREDSIGSAQDSNEVPPWNSYHVHVYSVRALFRVVNFERNNVGVVNTFM